jgi:TatA/E family protein of Tat protein translocase
MNLGFSEMIFLFFLALIIFGPKKMPEIGRQIGKALNEFRRASNEFRSQIETEIANLEREVKPEILPPTQPPAGAVASGSLVDVPPAEHVPAQLTAPDSSNKAADA